MRLLETTTYVLAQFQSQIPSYAILSHVWEEEEEVTFGDIAMLNKATKMKGFAKIVGACKAALKDGLKYIWIDTCCINKESSAELSEAINSIFMWYKNAHVCYAYLSDVPSDEDPSVLHSSFAMSRWFTRGWTLQELLAPFRVVFHGADWGDVGTKATLCETISIVTGISTEHIKGIDDKTGDSLKLDGVPVAVKMSWAAHRTTTREEDIAYSLMGLFGVNMPLLYGEGGKAFMRLQQEIIRVSDDHSIFVFLGNTTLARSPSEFRQSGGVKLLKDIGEPQAPYSITLKGLDIQLPLSIVTQPGSSDEKTFALLNCCLNDDSERLALELQTYPGEGRYWRIPHDDSEQLHFGIPSWCIRKGPSQLSSIYITDGNDIHSTASRNLTGTLTLLLRTATVPAYSSQELDPITARWRGIHFDWREVEVEELVKITDIWTFIRGQNKWKIVGNLDSKSERWSLELAFGDSTRNIEFVVTAFGQEGRTLGCLTENPPAARAALKSLMDRSSITLKDGRVVTATLGASIRGTGFAEMNIEIKRSAPTLRSAPLPKPAIPNCTALLVIPPAPDHGYILVANKLTPYEEWDMPLKCIPRHGSFVVYVNNDLDGYRVAVGPFKRLIGRPLFLFLVEHASVNPSRVTARDPVTTVSQGGWDGEGGHPLGESYSVTLDEGKNIYVATWKSRDTSLANYCIKLSLF
jgi:hypothetical protein